MTLQANPPVNQGAVNFPKLLRHFRHRTNQVRDLVFERDPIFRKEVMTTKADSSSGRGSGTTSLSGPAVSFGYEESSFAAQSEAHTMLKNCPAAPSATTGPNIT